MITLALIGIGRWGQNYIKTIGNIKNANLKYICASNRKNLGNFPDKYIKLTDYKDLQKYRDIDGIIIATPSNTHYEIAKFFLSRGQNVLIEKPLTTNFKEAEELAEIFKMTKLVAMVGHIYLYNSAYLKSKEFIKKIGRIRYLDFEGCDFGPFPQKTSALWEWAPHDVSMCLDLLSEMPQSVSAWSVDRDMVFAQLKFKNTKVFMRLGWLSPVKKRRVTVVGSTGSLIFDDTAERKICFYKYSETDNITVFYPEHSKEEPLVTELKEFVNCLKSNKKPKTDLESSILIIKVITAMQKSIDSDGKTICV